MKPEAREIFIDLNARITENGYVLTGGSLDDLAMLGFTAEQAVGMPFTFNGGDDTPENGETVEIVFDGTIEKDPRWGYLAVSNGKGMYWRAKAA